ncbi:MAG TPA: glycerophosphodiester phosphodiesterase [Candidatus Kapabacteria bacterium]|nr:glycerophosphodiester phosphodiesterase [Candidatus Kapabacteria bacterium]
MINTITNFGKWCGAFFETGPVPKPSPREFLVIGHRGSPVYEVENTIASFEKAVEFDGVNALEMDLSMLGDGEIVLWHDWDPTDHIAMARNQGFEPDVKFAPRLPKLKKYHRPLHELTYPEFIANFGYKEKARNGKPVGAIIPTLEETLKWLKTKPQVRYVCWDIKTPERDGWIIPRMMTKLYSLLSEYEPHYKSVFLTPYIPIMEAMEAHCSHPNYMLDVEPPAGIILDPCKFTSSKMAIKYHNAFCDTIHPKAMTIGPWTTFKRVINCDVQTKKKFNATNPRVPIDKIVGATINAREEMEALIGIGIDGLMSDDPKLLRQVADDLGMTLWPKESRPLTLRELQPWLRAPQSEPELAQK